MTHSQERTDFFYPDKGKIQKSGSKYYEIKGKASRLERRKEEFSSFRDRKLKVIDILRHFQVSIFKCFLIE